MRKLLFVILPLLFIVSSSFALSIDPNGTYCMSAHGATWVVSWTDQFNRTRVCELYKDSTGNFSGISPHMNYSDPYGNYTEIIPSDPGNGSPWNCAFGATVHHGGSFSGGGSFNLRVWGNHIAIFDKVQNCDNAIEVVTWTFMDGHDYFQWADTVDARLGTQTADSRGPYSDVNWQGAGAPVTNVDYGMNGYFNMKITNVDYMGLNLYGPWTVVGYITAALPYGNVDIPYCREQSQGREVGYVQSQTYQQQLAGDNTMNQSGRLGVSRNPYGNVINSGNDASLFDTQMNFFDSTIKITWGTPLGFMNHGNTPGDALGRQNNGDKNQWGQYSLSCVLDMVAQGGVMRVRNENRAVQSNQFTVSASIGSLKLEGPVGTSNVNNRQTLVPAGWDHNYRTWWACPNAAQKLKLTINGNNGTSMVNPTFRIRNMNTAPSSIMLNGTALADGVDYYIDVIADTTSLSGTTNEVWLTLKRTLSGMNNILAINTNGSGGGGGGGGGFGNVGFSSSNSTLLVPVKGATFNQPFIYSNKGYAVMNGIKAVFPSGFSSSKISFTGTAGSAVVSLTDTLVRSNCISVYQFTSTLDYSLKPVQFTLQYDPKMIPSGSSESQLMLYFYNGIEWVKVAGDLDMINHLFKFNSNMLSGTYCLFVTDPNRSDTGKTPTKKPDFAQWSYNPFSPNGDGLAETTRLEIQLTSASKVSLQIFTRDHGLVRTLVNEQSMNGKTYVEWDGKNNKGKVVGPGAYIYVLKIGAVVRKGVIVVAY